MVNTFVCDAQVILDLCSLIIKDFFSIVLQALVDANYKFINIDFGGYGKQSDDGGTFKASDLYKKLINGTLNLPEDSPLPGSDLVMV